MPDCESPTLARVLPREPGKDLRSLFHDQGNRQRDRPGAFGRAGHCGPKPWRHPRSQRARPGDRGPGLYPGQDKNLAEVQEVSLTRRDIQEWYGFLEMLSPEGKTSMLQDIEAGRKTEVEMFAGEIAKMGKAHHVPTPVNQTILHLIRVLEQAGPAAG